MVDGLTWSTVNTSSAAREDITLSTAYQEATCTKQPTQTTPSTTRPDIKTVSTPPTVRGSLPPNSVLSFSCDTKRFILVG